MRIENVRVMPLFDTSPEVASDSCCYSWIYANTGAGHGEELG